MFHVSSFLYFARFAQGFRPPKHGTVQVRLDQNKRENLFHVVSG